MICKNEKHKPMLLLTKKNKKKTMKTSHFLSQNKLYKLGYFNIVLGEKDIMT